MTGGQYSVVIIYSTSHALRVEKLFLDKDIRCKLIPVPRQISSDCGVCVRILRADVDAARQAIEATGVEIEGIHDI